MTLRMRLRIKRRKWNMGVLYRAVKQLQAGDGKYIQPGEVTELGWLSMTHVDMLLVRGAVVLVSAPPLAAVPGWARRARKLEVGGIITLSDVASADTATVAELGKVSLGVAEDWKAAARALLDPPTNNISTED